MDSPLTIIAASVSIAVAGTLVAVLIGYWMGRRKLVVLDGGVQVHPDRRTDQGSTTPEVEDPYREAMEGSGDARVSTMDEERMPGV